MPHLWLVVDQHLNIGERTAQHQTYPDYTAPGWTEHRGNEADNYSSTCGSRRSLAVVAGLQQPAAALNSCLVDIQSVAVGLVVILDMTMRYRQVLETPHRHSVLLLPLLPLDVARPRPFVAHPLPSSSASILF